MTRREIGPGTRTGEANVTISKVNSWGLAESVIEPSTTAHPAAADRTWTVGYDENANPVTLTAPGGVVRTRTFDAADRLSAENGTGGGVATVARSLTYDAVGALTSASAPGGPNTYAYNDRGLMISAAGPSGSASFGYDGDANLTSRTDAAGTATFTYLKGRLATEKDGITAATQTLGYDAAGSLSSVNYGSGRVPSYTYDDFGRLATDTLKNSANTTVSSMSYGYDLDDRMTKKTTTGTAGAAANTYVYDQAGRMTSWTKDGTTTAYAWDASGNRTQAGAKTATYDARNRLLSDSDYTYSYSPRGSLASRTSSGLAEPFSFDAFDRLVSQGSTTYTYDGLDRVASRAGTAQTYAGTGDDLVGDGTELYARGAYDELMAISAGTSKRTTLSDQHGDVIGAFETSNTALTSLDDSVAFDPFGQVLASSVTAHHVGFQGDYTDPSTGEVNMGSRWYSPGTGTFLSRDTAQYSSGPSILANRYAYGAGDPMDYSDPDGNWPSCSLCHKVTKAVSSAVSSVGSAVRTVATYVYRAVQTVAHFAVSAVKAVGRAVASAARAVYSRAKAAVSWVGSKIVSAGRALASRAAAAASWAREKAEAAKRAAVARAKAVTATAKRAVAAAIKHNPLPAIKAALKPVLAGVKTLVSAAASLPANVVAGTRDVLVDAAKATQAIYEKALDKAGVVIEAVSTASSVAGEFAAAAMPTLLGVAAGLATTGVCMASSLGIAAPACIVAGFAVGGAVTSALQCAPGRSVAGCAARGGAAGAVAGAITAATGGLGAGVLATAGAAGASEAAGSAVGQYLNTGSVDVGEAAAAGAAGAVLGGLTHGLVKARGGGGKAPTSCTTNSFVPGTRVLMADGSTKAIEDVQVGDLVLATDPTTGKTTTKPVTDLIVGSGEKHLVAVTVDTDGDRGHTVETITATDGHPFWVDGNGDQLSSKDDEGGHWSDAGDLRTGDRLHTPKGGGSVAVLDTSTRTEIRTVHNLTVDGVHTYYIQTGDTDVLVHNCPSSADDDLIRMRHYTTKSGAVSILNDGVLLAKDQNKVFMTRAKGKPMAPTDAEDYLGIGRGHGNAVIEFDVKRTAVRGESNSRTGRSEWVADGNLPFINGKRRR